MNISAISRFNQIDGNATIHTKAGSTVYQGHIQLEWPEYTCKKDEWYLYYSHLLREKGYTDAHIKDCMYSMIDDVTELNKN